LATASSAASITISLLEGATTKPAPMCLGNSDLLVEIAAQAGGEVHCQLGYEKDALSEHVAHADGQGLCRITLRLPDVRHRITATIYCRSGGREGRQDVDILPSNMLQDARVTLERMRIGVLDQHSGVQEILKSQEIAFENLKPLLKRDFFDGGMVILSGFELPGDLDDVLGRLEGRIRAGMVAIVVDPPAGCKLAAVQCVESPKAKALTARFSAGWASIVKPRDLAAEPYRRALEINDGSEVLAWLELPDGAQPSASFSVATRPAWPAKLGRLGIIVATPLGKGYIVAFVPPQSDGNLVGPVGRCLLNETIRWSAAKLSEKQP
jgi:hypothetical protein